MASTLRTVAPTAEPVSLPEQIAHGRILDSDEGVLVQSYITAARARCEAYLGMAFVSQTWRLNLERWPTFTQRNRLRAIELPRPPLQSVTSITYVDTSGVTQTLGASSYTVNTNKRPGQVTPVFNAYWPINQYVANTITITYIAGFGGTASPTVVESVAAVPVEIKTAIMIYAQWLYQQRDIDSEMPRAVKDLLDSASCGNYTSWFPDQVA